MRKKTKKEIDQEVDAEIEAQTKEELLLDFNRSQALHVPARKFRSRQISIKLPEKEILKDFRQFKRNPRRLP